MPTELVAQRLHFLDRSGRPVVGVDVLDGSVPTLTDPQPTLSSCLAKVMGSVSTLAGC
jgi:hypothetical protein